MKSGFCFGGLMDAVSPSDRLNHLGRIERAAQFGLQENMHDESFESNQSFPRALQPQSKFKQTEIMTGDITHIRGCELNSVNFLKRNLLRNHNDTSLNSKAEAAAARRHLLNDTTFNKSQNQNVSCMSQANAERSWMFYNQLITNSYLNLAETSQEQQQLLTVSNPNKALICINGRTTEILTANDISCDLFGYNEADLIGRKLKDLLDVDGDQLNAERKEALMETDKLDQNGRVVLCSGKIFEAYIVDPFAEAAKRGESNADSKESKLKIPISIYMLKLTDEQEPRCLCVMEPIQRIVGTFTINFKGRLCFYNPNFSYIFGYTSTTQQSVTNTPSSLAAMTSGTILKSKDISELIPNIKLPINGINREVQKQLLTGRSFQGDNIPLTVNILKKQLHNEEIVYNCSVSVYTNISGLFTVRPTDFQINSYNPAFTRLIFGHDDKELLNKPITFLIPNFFDPDTSSTMTNKMTPYNSITSSKNKNNTNSNNLLSINGYPKYKSTNLNINGSFLDSNNKTAAATRTPSKLAYDVLNKQAMARGNRQLATAVNIPSFHITEVDAISTVSTLDNQECKRFSEKICKNCQKKFINANNNNNNNNTNNKFEIKNSRKRKIESNEQHQEQDETSKQIGGDLLSEFNLQIEDYSPNKKCANYIDTNSFSPCKGSSSSPTIVSSGGNSACNTPQSTAKKSLLAKAITNNVTNAIMSSTSSVSVDQMSCLSNCLSASLVDVSPSKSSRATDMDLHDMEVVLVEDELNDDEMDLCEECRMKEGMIEDMACNEDKSEVSLIMDHTHDFEIEKDAAMTAETESKRLKPGVLQIQEEKEVRRVSLLSDKNENKEEQPKKFKNITSTPAAQHSHAKNGSLLSYAVANGSSGGGSGVRRNHLSGSAGKFKAANGGGCLLNTSDGLFFGRAKHSDASFIKVFYQRKLVNMRQSDNKESLREINNLENANGCLPQDLICVWISRDPYSDKSMIDYSLDQSQLLRVNNNTINTPAHSGAPSPTDTCNYLKEYEDIRTLGRGASGFVQLAKRKLDKFEVVTKYILRSKIYKENLIEDERYGCVPLEISILCKLDHANVIKVLEVFHDADHIQMVMEKHGCGMDLFEFIDRQRKHIDEGLASYIFRQIVSAVAYLHSKDIVHRDIKDENIVINESFHIKLIDFGSAAYVTKGKKFATFCGTMDYCSPDILLGNKYFGPELDAWTCGIALYTLVFCENPFLSAEETIECILKPPFKVSKELMKLLFSILCPKPELRATMDEISNDEWVNQSVDMTKFKWENVVRDTEFHTNDAGDCFRDEEYNLNHTDLALKSVKRGGDEDDDDDFEEEVEKENSNQQQVKTKTDFFNNLNAQIFSKSF